MSKLIALIISCMIVITGVNAAYGAEYADVKPAHWAHGAVSAMSEKAIIIGYLDGSFRPDNTVTYGEFIKMALIAATGEDAGNSPIGHWATNYYNKALEQEYFTEYDIEKDDLGKQITRAHMALVISSILGDVKIDDYDEIQKGITDITYQTKYEYDITKAYATGILTGYTDNTFRPEKTLSRAEAATVIHRLVDESKRVLPKDGKEAEPAKETMTYTRTWVNGETHSSTYYVENVKLGDYGIDKIERITVSGDIVAYSSVCYDSIWMYIDNTLMNGAVNANGTNYWERDGYYVYDLYVASDSRNPASITGKIPIIAFCMSWDEKIDTVYRFIDVTL